MRTISMLAAAAALALAGCSEKKAAAPAAGAPAARPGETSASGVAKVKGKVLEKLDAASYTYLRLQTDKAEAWAAVQQTAMPVGTEVVVEGTWMNGFESKTLGRKFDSILFGQLGGGPGPGATPEQIARAAAATGNPPSDLMAGLPPGHPPLAPADVPGDVKVEKAAGADARTVAEVWDQRSKLKDAKVAVKGKVVKMNAGIMGKTWLHLRDGTGTVEAKNNDLTVTTAETAVSVGDVVTVEGLVAVDKDFGAGYRYPVIVEGASVKK